MTDTGLPDLRREIDRAGYYPQLVAEAIEDALAAEDGRACCVHQETTFDADEVRRHMTVLALTPTGSLSPTPTTTRPTSSCPRPTSPPPPRRSR